MATPNIVPRADSEGGIGTSSKYWASAYIDLIYVGAGKVGRDADNNLDFSTDNRITFVAQGSNKLILNSSTLKPAANDGITLGNSGTGWSDLFLASGAVINFDNSNVTLTHSSGVLRLADSDSLGFGTGADLKIDHDGSHSYIYNSTGNLEITNYADDSDIIFKSDDGSGGTTAYLTLDGSAANMKVDKDMRFNDSVDAEFGTSGDFKIYHDGSNTYLEQINAGTGNIVISNANDDGDIVFNCDNGSGGTETYFYLDGSLSIGNPYTVFPDDSILTFGNSQDLQIKHSSSYSYIDNTAGGDLVIRQFVNDKDIIFQSDDGAGSTANYFYLDGSSATHDGSATTGLYTNWPDYSRISMGTSHDLQIYHDSTNSHLYNSTGDLYITNAGDNKDILLQSDDGSGGVTTYFQLDGSAEKMLMKKSTVFTGGGMDYGVDGTGADVIFYGDTAGRDMKWDQSEDHLLFKDSTYLKLGTGADLRLYHDGSSSYIEQAGNGNLTIYTSTDDGDIIFRADDGSGGVTTYLTLDGGDVSTIVSTIKVLMPNLPTSDPSVAGQLWNSSGDLKISAG